MNALITINTALPGALTTAEIGLARLRRLVRLQGRHSPACARGYCRRLPLQPR